MIYLAGIAFGYTAVIMRWTPYIVSVCMALVMLFITWVKKKWENFTVHRFGIWWSPQKVLLGDFLCPKGGKPIDLAALQADAAAFESEAWIPLARLQHITKTRLNRGAERRSGAV